MNYDQELSAWGRSLPHAHSVGTFWWWADKYGEWPTWIAVFFCLGLYLYSVGAKRRARDRVFLAFILLTALISPIIITQSLKAIIYRPRPSPGYMLPNSFPSGHTASAFVLFAFTYLVPTKKRTLKVLTGVVSGAWGLAVGVSRVVWGAHYPSDVLAGAFLTLMTEYLLWRGLMGERKNVM